MSSGFPPEAIERLVGILREAKVARYRDGDLEIIFEPERMVMAGGDKPFSDDPDARWGSHVPINVKEVLESKL